MRQAVSIPGAFFHPVDALGGHMHIDEMDSVIARNEIQPNQCIRKVEFCLCIARTGCALRTSKTSATMSRMGSC